jgi:glycosyltransferase involved in cell wall biosynthesis
VKILQIAPQVPYPPSDGGKVGIYNITRHLAALGHEVTLFAFDRAPGVEYGPLSEFCDLRRVTHSTRNSPWGALLNIFSDLPYTISKYRSENLEQQLVNFVEQHRPDVVHVDHLHMAGYGARLRERFGLPVVLREHNIESVIVERFADHARNPAVRRYARLQQGRMRRYEARMAGMVDVCCPITPDDARKLIELNPAASVRVVPGGVEASYFTPAGGSAAAPDSIVFFGGMDWLPNQDAVGWFLDDIFPIILASRPAATLTIVGKHIPPAIAKRAGPRVVIRGFAEDLRAEVQKHAVSIAPFRIGGGMRLKIIESFAMGVPVVSTAIGCEGIGAEDGEQIVVADSPGDFAAAVTELLTGGERARTIAGAARVLASERYRWEAVAAMFESVYREALGGARTRHG